MAFLLIIKVVLYLARITARQGCPCRRGASAPEVLQVEAVADNGAGDTLFTKEFFNPYYPDASFLFTAALKIDPNGNLIVLSGIDANLTDAYNGDIYLLKFDSKSLDAEGGRTRLPHPWLPSYK